MRHLAVAALCCLVLSGSVGCVPGATETTRRELTVVVGQLVSGRSDDGEFRCVWLQDDTGHRTEVIFFDGWDYVFDPLRLVDTSGNVVAREGDWIRVTGPADRLGASVCSPGPPLPADTVEVLAAPPPE